MSVLAGQFDLNVIRFHNQLKLKTKKHTIHEYLTYVAYYSSQTAYQPLCNLYDYSERLSTSERFVVEQLISVLR